MTDYGVTLTATLVSTGTRDEEGWEHDTWHVVLKRGEQSMTVPTYRTGIGHRRTRSGCQLQLRGRYEMLVTPKGKVCQHMVCQDQGVKPHPPTLYDVLTSLKADMTHGAGFEEWCGDFGLDTDSRKAMDTYLACQREETELRRLMGDQFTALLNDEEYI